MLSSLTPVLMLAAMVVAQTWTDCNPLDTTCLADTALGKKISETFASESSYFTAAGGGAITYGAEGAQLTMNARGQAPTLISNFHIFFGRVDVIAKAATGTGIVSSLVLESDDLDEIDFEWLGGDTTQVQSNYFGKGDTTTYDRGAYHGVATPQSTFHRYTVESSAETIVWSIDGTPVRTLNYADAQGGSRFPQTPFQVRFGIWAGGDPSNAPGTIEWAGGETDFNDVPFTMTVQKITVQDHCTGTSYTYGDRTGSWQSIKGCQG